MQAPAVQDKFSISEALGTGWDVTKKNFLLLLGIAIVAGIVIAIPVLFAKLAAERLVSGFTLMILQFICGVVHFVLQWLMEAGIIKVSLDFVRKRSGAFEDLFSCGPVVVSYFVGSIVYGAIVAVGLILFIVPGIMWAIQFRFFNYAIVDEKCGPFAALHRSSELTRGSRWPLLGFALVCLALNVLGLLCLGVGIIVSGMITIIAIASVYEQLKQHTAGAAGAPQASPAADASASSD